MEVNVQLFVRSPDSEKSASVPSVEGSLSGIYQPVWGVTNSCRLDTVEAFQDMIDHTAKIRTRGQTAKKGQSQEVHGLRNRTHNLETLLEAEVDMKKAAEAKNVELTKELERLRVQFSDLQVHNDHLSQQMSNIQAQVTGEEKIKAIFEEFKRYEDDKVERRCVEMDTRLDALSIDFDEELYPHMLTAIAGRRWVIGQDLHLTVMKCAESTELRHAFTDVLTIPVYPKVRDPTDPWACKEELLLEDAIAANISLAEKKKKCQVVCRTYGVGFAHRARSDGVPVSAPTVAPQGLAILVADTATQTKDEASPKLIRSKSFPPMYNLDWP
ncbi:hypothetical protein Tco_0460893 [Tanacetum coccineum]